MFLPHRLRGRCLGDGSGSELIVFFYTRFATLPARAGYTAAIVFLFFSVPFPFRPIAVPMKIFVRAEPSAKETKVDVIDATHVVVSVKEPPVRGRANRAIAEAFARHFGVPASRV